MAYLFKDTDLAAQRLRMLAEVFEPASRAFLREVALSERPELALDLGCGPGYTTRLVSEITGSALTFGIDASDHFVELATAENASESISFVRHDLTQIPFPTGAGELVFCRMLLTHLRDPLAMIELWGTQVQPRGLLLLDEVEWIHTDHALFQTYLAIVAAMLSQQANQLYIGPTLDQFQPRGLKRQVSRVYQLPVSTRQAAMMFSLNIPSWKNQPFIQTTYAPEQLARLEEDLRELAEHATGEEEITWGMRQIAYQRV